jgi:uncharacterized protein YigE (DUF2233 family)
MTRSGAMMLLPVTALLGCTCAPHDPVGAGEGASAASSGATAALSAGTGPHPAGGSDRCTGDLVTSDLAPGVRLQRVRAPVEPTVDIGDRCVTLVRVDPGRHRIRLLTALATGRSRAASTWADEFHLTGVINASMYLSDQRSVGLMVDGASVNQPSDNPKLGGFLALDPTRDGLPAIAAFGRDCAGFDLDAIRRDYRVVIQNYRLLDCAGRPIRWQDAKVYSSAAIGVGKEGDAVFIHARTPYSMTDLATVLALPELSLKSAMFVEGGPEASLYVRAQGGVVREIGSYETGFRPDDSNDKYWEIPNILGFSPR